MKAEMLLFIGAALPLLWGVAHLFPTQSIVRGFGEISPDHRKIIAMEWLIEGVALIFIGALVALVTAVAPVNVVSTVVYLLSAVCLVVLAIISLFTGFRIDFLPFRLCPLIFTAAATLITAGWMMQ